MERLNFSLEIDAPAAKVWEALWNDRNYREWTSVFMEGSYLETNWNEGSRIKFLSPAGDGMYSTIERRKLNEMMCFTHIGMIKNGEELPVDDETRQWSGSQENYYLSEQNGKTTLRVDLDTSGEYTEHFNKIFPKALAKVKNIAERTTS